MADSVPQYVDDPSITQATVIHRRVVTRGSRVRHRPETFTGGATATVTGFCNKGTAEDPWIKVIIKSDRPNSRSAELGAWDWDRVILPDAP